VSVIESLESEVRSYCRTWPAVFETAEGSYLTDTAGRRYLDFFSGAGALNYGHNNPVLLEPLLRHLTAKRVTHSLDMATRSKTDFLHSLERNILGPRGADYKVQFTGPTGSDAVEAALKIARKASGRRTVVAFHGAFHGMTLGSLAVTANEAKRRGAGVPLDHVLHLPYDSAATGAHGGSAEDTPAYEHGLAYLKSLLTDGTHADSGTPGAVIVETVQGEGGARAASADWLRRLSALCHQYGLILIVDDVQAGCGRTGPFFSFEDAGIVPDVVCLSKSISGYGLPMSLVLMRPHLDLWRPGEHTGTFRGNNLAFVTATAALDHYWVDHQFEEAARGKALFVDDALSGIVDEHHHLGAAARGRGLLRGVVFEDPQLAQAVSRAAFERGLLVETAGARSEVVKLLPPLTASTEELAQGIDILGLAIYDSAKSAR
jgi:diaminobutyrate-2-oxoglutarate transaminase